MVIGGTEKRRAQRKEAADAGGREGGRKAAARMGGE